MIDKNNNFFKIENHFKETEHIPSVPIFENHLKEVPRFSIAIPTYKRTKYLKEALESALNQDTCEPYEVIVVDNNPERDDETESFMKEYSSVPNLSYYKNTENLGMVGNWNRLYSLSRTEWVVMLHDDDMLMNDFLSFHTAIIAQLNNPDIIYPSIYLSNGNKESLRKIYCHRIDISDFLLGNIIGPPLGMLAKRDIILNIGGFRKKLYPALDMDLYARAAYNGYKSYRIQSTPRAMYRIGINESLKEETLLGYIKNHKELESAILYNKNFIYKNFINNCIAGRMPIFFKSFLLVMAKDNYSMLNDEYKKALIRQTKISKLCFDIYLNYKRLLRLIHRQRIYIYNS